MEIKTLDIFNGEKKGKEITMDYMLCCNGNIISDDRSISSKDIVKLNYRSDEYNFYLYQNDDGGFHTIFLKKK